MPLTDEMISKDTAQQLAEALESVVSGTRMVQLRRTAEAFDQSALRERADLMRDALLTDLGGDYFQLAHVIRQAKDKAAGFSGWMIWPVTTAIATKALSEDSEAAFDDGMDLLAELTGLLTSEFAIRILITHDIDRALSRILTWTGSADEHVRRLASEGTRPFLPWAIRVSSLRNQAISTVPILDALYRDSSEYVRRSVANHLNDLSRDHPDLVVETATRWMEQPDDNTAWVVRHGLRTLTKRGNSGALALLGFVAAPGTVQIDGPHLDHQEISIGQSLGFHASIQNSGQKQIRLAIDYVVYYAKASGTQAPKVFKLTTKTLEPGQVIKIQRTHAFRQLTTRRHYPGPHAIALQVNGVLSEPTTFQLTAET